MICDDQSTWLDLDSCVSALGFFVVLVQTGARIIGNWTTKKKNGAEEAKHLEYSAVCWASKIANNNVNVNFKIHFVFTVGYLHCSMQQQQCWLFDSADALSLHFEIPLACWALLRAG